MSNAKAIQLTAAAVMIFTVISLGTAQADTYHFKDTLKPNERGIAAKYADGQACGASAGHTFSNVPAFEECMRAHGWVVDRYTPDPSMSRVAARRAAPSSRDTSSYIDPDTGLVCRNTGGIAICVPPQGTVKYYDSEHGLNCQRTGLFAVCSNL